MKYKTLLITIAISAVVYYIIFQPKIQSFIYEIKLSSSMTNQTYIIKTTTSYNTLNLLLAESSLEQQRGMMLLLKPTLFDGMLFDFQKYVDYSFWMKDCRIPLDIIFLDSNYNLIEYFDNVPICSETPCPSYKPLLKYRFVIELPAEDYSKTDFISIFRK